MARFKAAVIGTGFIGPVHIEGLRRAGVDVVGLLGSSAETSARKAEEFGIPRGYADLDELLADAEVDVVHVTSPNHLHYPQVKACIAAGKHVVCEKPLAMDTAEGEELLQLAEQKGIFHAVNFNIRFYPLVHEAKARVESGQIGDVLITQGSYLQDWLLYDTDWNWRLQPEFSGSMRAVADIGSHWLDLNRFITGKEIDSVCADFKTFHPIRQKPDGSVETFTGKNAPPKKTQPAEIGTEDYASILIRYVDGSRGVVTVSQVSAGRKNRLSFEIDGTHRSLAWDSERPNELWIGHRDEPNQNLLRDPSLLSPLAASVANYPGGHNEGFPDTFKQLYKKFYAALATGVVPTKPEYPTFADGVVMLKVGDAIFTSAQEDRWVKL